MKELSCIAFEYWPVQDLDGQTDGMGWDGQDEMDEWMNGQ